MKGVSTVGETVTPGYYSYSLFLFMMSEKELLLCSAKSLVSSNG